MLMTSPRSYETASNRSPHSTQQSGTEVIMEYPLSSGQRALWFMQKMAPESVAHNVVHALRIMTAVDTVALQRVFERLVDRHAVLRTTFAERNGKPVQQVHRGGKVCFSAEDASDWSTVRLDDRLAQEMFRPFDLERGPLARMFVFTLSPQDHLVLLAMHHIVTDMWSIAIIIYEVCQMYQAEIAGDAVAFRPPRGEYVDYVRHQAEMLDSPEGEEHWAFWRKQLSGELPMLDLPTDRPRSWTTRDQGSAATARLGVKLTKALKDLGKAHGTALHIVALAAFQVLLHRYTGQYDLVVGFPKAGRSRPMVRTIGYFINLVPIRVDFSSNPTFSRLLEQVRTTTQEAAEHDAYPFPLLVERLQPKRRLSRSPIFDVVFSWQKTTRLVDSRDMGSFALGQKSGGMEVAGLPLEPVALPRRVTPFDLTVLMAEAGDELVATLEYSDDLFDAATMEQMLIQYRTLLEQIVSDPDQRVSTISLLTEVERRQLILDWNDTAAAYSGDRCVHELFEMQVERTPDAQAVVFEEESLTYREVNSHSNQLAHYLQDLGIGPETIVGIAVERSPQMVVGLLGILKAGGAYLPLDPAYPQERLAFMVEDSQMSVVLTQERLLEKVPANGAKVFCLDADWDSVRQVSCENLGSAATSGNLAYVIYTSGSTGRPKGVLLQHRGLINLVEAQTNAFGVDSGDRILQFASFSFDASVSETFMALLRGATLCLAHRDALMSVPDLHELLRHQAITMVTLPPSLLSVLPAEGLPSLRTVISAGEACSSGIVARWRPNRRFFNAYGPTEATIGPTLYPVEYGMEEMTNIPIGRPIANAQVYLLDDRLQPAPIGVPGELHIGGVGLARGYVNRPGMTARSFVPHPFSDEPGARLYKSGDLARYRRDGTIEFLGRTDHQVKVRGFRIELGEVEAALERHPALRQVVVLAREDEGDDERLVAYIVPNEFPIPPVPELRCFLGERLPEYMIPSSFVTMEALPLTASGKVDRKALPVPEGARPDLGSTYVEPRTEMERKLAIVWRQVLGVGKVGINDNFFDMGGHSLMLAKVYDRVQELVEKELSMVELFRYPTIAALAEYLTGGSQDRHSWQRSQERVQRQRAGVMRQRRLMRDVSRGR